MRQDDGSTPPNREPLAGGGPTDRPPADEGTTIMPPLGTGEETIMLGPPAADAGSPATVGGPAGAPAEALCPNPNCRQPVGPGLRFCQACGAEVAAAGSVEEEKGRPWLAAVTVVWLLIAAAAFLFLYANAFVGRR